MVDVREAASQSVAELEAAITEGAGHLAAFEARWLALVAEFDRREGWVAWGARSCAHWLSWRCSLDLRSARDKVRVARALEDLPLVAEAFGAGRLSYSKVRAVTRVATPGTEEDLVMLAEHATAAQLDRIVRSFRGVLAADEELAEANERHARRYFHHEWADDGSLVFHGRLSPEDGALLIEALDAAHAQVPTAPDDGSAEPHVDNDGSAEPHYPTSADALVVMAEGFLANGTGGRTGGDRFQIVLHTEADVLTHDAEGICEIDDGPTIAPETARRLACDSSIVWMLTGPDGEPVNVSRKTRTIPPAIRRAARARDKTCRFPGCDHPHFVDLHHIEHYTRGGPTTLANLVLLCWFHHRLVHEGGWSVSFDDAGVLRVYRPDASELTVPPAIVDPAAGVEPDNHRHEVVVTPDTVIPSSNGAALDLDHVIDSLMWVREREARQWPGAAAA